MRAESFADMIYLEGPEYPEYGIMHIFYLKFSGTPKCGNMLGKFSPSWSCPTNNRKLPKIFGLSTMKEYVLCIYIYIFFFLHNIVPGILQVIISNGMVVRELACDIFQQQEASITCCDLFWPNKSLPKRQNSVRYYYISARFSAKTKRGRREGDGKKKKRHDNCDKRHDNLRLGTHI